MKGLFSKPITYVIITLIGFAISEAIIVTEAIKHPFIIKTKKSDKED